MANENGKWVMHGVAEDDPLCLRNCDDLIRCVNEFGFLPLFQNTVPGFSVEERTVPYFWWTGDPVRDPWEWRIQATARAEVAYGKFFDNKAGFISLEWLPYFANWRRDGYDFDARYDDEKAGFRQKKIMDCFNEADELYSFDLKRKAGFGSGGEKNFEGTITGLQMQTYLAIKAFRCRRNKRGEEYGWHIAVYAMPESIFGADAVTSAYSEAPEVSRQRIYTRMKDLFPKATDEQMYAILR